MHVIEESVEFWVERGYKRIEPSPTPKPKRAPAKRK